MLTTLAAWISIGAADVPIPPTDDRSEMALPTTLFVPLARVGSTMRPSGAVKEILP